MDKELEALLNRAKEFASGAHRGQKRKFNGAPYMSHLEATFNFLWSTARRNISDEAYVAALLHDTVEDTDTEFCEIEREFGLKVANLVMELTNDRIKVKKESKKQYLADKLNNMSKEALAIKLSDRMSNISDLTNRSVPESFVSKYLEETIYILNNLNTKLDFIQRELVSLLKATLLYIKVDRLS